MLVECFSGKASFSFAGVKSNPLITNIIYELWFLEAKAINDFAHSWNNLIN